jgi:KH domain
VVREVLVDQSLVGLIVGNQGSTIKRIQDAYKVQVVVERASAGGDKRKVTVMGHSEEEVDKAVQEVSIERLYIPIQTSLIEEVCGPNDSNLHFFQEGSQVLQLSVHQDNATGGFSLAAVGTKPALDDLQFFVQTKLDLLKVQLSEK